MNKKFSLSKTSIYLILLVLALIVYVFVYFIPAQSELAMLRSEIALYNAETAIYRQYLDDPSPLEADIADIQAEIARMNTEDYTNDSTVSFEIGTAIQRFKISLVSVTLDTVTEIDGMRALPICLKMNGEMDNLMKFIRYFENDEDGSYLVRGTAFEVAGNTINASMVIYLCTPNV